MIISTSLVVTFHHLFTILCQKIQNFPHFRGIERISPPGAYWRIYGTYVLDQIQCLSWRDQHLSTQHRVTVLFYKNQEYFHSSNKLQLVVRKVFFRAENQNRPFRAANWFDELRHVPDTIAVRLSATVILPNYHKYNDINISSPKATIIELSVLSFLIDLIITWNMMSGRGKSRAGGFIEFSATLTPKFAMYRRPIISSWIERDLSRQSLLLHYLRN